MIRSLLFVISIMLLTGHVSAQSPYDRTFKVRKSDAPFLAGPDAGAFQKGTIKKGTDGIILRWCRDEFPFRDWAFGGRSKHLKLLNERVCEVSVDGRIGFMNGRDLKPE
ncbi:MAG: hypothetical protein JKY49_03430 [Cohaesibacteraceae bacterium]|nr:hypothetical protein [Cohaesibacteraceae bacterium]MBL4875139.1 hypothetical protein [Cohaesibacteraceae bacterium]